MCKTASTCKSCKCTHEVTIEVNGITVTVEAPKGEPRTVTFQRAMKRLGLS